MAPLISIITPVFNRADCIAKCIESVALQKTDLLEHIVIDDGSSDLTYQIINKIATRIVRLKILKNEFNFGINYALNRGIEVAEGKFCIILDSDDELATDASDFIIEALRLNPQISHFLFLTSDKKIRTNSLLKNQVSEILYEDWLHGRIEGDFVHIIKTIILKECKFFEDFRIYEDLNFFRIYKKTSPQLFYKKVAVIKERNRTDSVSQEYRLINLMNINEQYRYLRKFLELYFNDFRYTQSGKINAFLRRIIIFGYVLGRNEELENCIMLLTNQREKMVIRIILRLPLRTLLLHLIYFKSYINQIKN